MVFTDDISTAVEAAQDATRAVFEAMKKHGVDTTDPHQIIMLLAGIVGILVGAAGYPEHRDKILDAVAERILEGIAVQDRLFEIRKRQ